MAEIVYTVKGMSCASCALRLEEGLRGLAGVREAAVDHVLCRARIAYDPALIGPERLAGEIRGRGYTADAEGARAGTGHGSMLPAALFTAALGGLLVLAWAGHLLGAPAWTVDLLAGAVAAIGGWPIAWKALRSALRLELNMDALVVVAATAAVLHGHVLEAGIVVFIMVLGELLEEITIARTSRAIRGLSSLLPDTATVRRGGAEEVVPCRDIRVGDLVVVRPGERAAVDGTVTAGRSAMDQSPVTGESMPLEKGPGDAVYSGAMNLSGALEVRAAKVGSDTTAARIAALIAEAQERKSRVQRLVDRFSAWFVPLMLGVAALVWLATGDPHRAITVLIVACPCALVLGTPTAVVAAIGAAARRGVVVRGGLALEALGRADTVVFDKTGTLTCGRPVVTAVHPLGGRSARDVLAPAAAAERFSEHHLARAVLERAAAEGLAASSPDSFTVRPGRGVEAAHGGRRILLGNRAFLAEAGVAVPGEADRLMREDEEAGRTALLVAVDAEVLGVLALADPARPGAREAVAALAAGGTGLAMMSGDNARTAAAAGRELGIARVEAGLLPAEKAARIEALRAGGRVVAMVGDGINDAPALAAADAGVAMGLAGTDLAVKTADAVLLNDDLALVPFALGLGRRTLSVIRQNLAFALVFNATMVTLASIGLLGMVTGAVCHQLSSLGVILNSMRLLLAGNRKNGNEPS